MAFSSALKQAIVDHVLMNTPLAQPASYWLGLSSTKPNNDGTNVTEPAGGGYARIEVTPGGFVAAAGDPAEATNANLLQWAQATADWGVMGWVVFYDASVAGTYYKYAEAPTPLNVTTGVQPEIAVGDLKVRASDI